MKVIVEIKPSEGQIYGEAPSQRGVPVTDEENNTIGKVERVCTHEGNLRLELEITDKKAIDSLTYGVTRGVS
jgi:hypothetical protein